MSAADAANAKMDKDEKINKAKDYLKNLQKALKGAEPGSAFASMYQDNIKKAKETLKKLQSESIRETKKMAKLKDILQEAFEDRPQIDKYKVVEGVKNFGIVGKQLYNNNNIVETAKQLAEIAESAHHHILGEQDDWFDKISVNKI